MRRKDYQAKQITKETWPFPTGTKMEAGPEAELVTNNPWKFPKAEDFEQPVVKDHKYTFPVIKGGSRTIVPEKLAITDTVVYEDTEGNRAVWVYPEVVPVEGETDPNGKSPHEAGSKVDAGKLRPWLVLGDFSRALELVTEVGTLGANKYTDHGWLSVENGEERYMEAFYRHMIKLGQGQVYDNGPNGIGTKHLAQMIWNLLAVLELEERNE